MTEARFPRAHRVCKRRDYERAQRCGVRISCPSFVLVLSRRVPSAEPSASRQADAYARLGLVASRRVGTAVVRNRAKRLVREWFRHHKTELPAGVDLVVILKTCAAGIGLAQVTAELDAALPQVTRRAAAIGRHKPKRS
jgi:ribonuclease P protein component